MNIRHDVSEEKRFYFHGHGYAKNISELIEQVTHASDDQLRHHINEQRHDVADWILSVYGNQDVAQKIRLCRSRSLLVKALQQALKPMPELGSQSASQTKYQSESLSKVKVFQEQKSRESHMKQKKKAVKKVKSSSKVTSGAKKTSKKVSSMKLSKAKQPSVIQKASVAVAAPKTAATASQQVSQLLEQQVAELNSHIDYLETKYHHVFEQQDLLARQRRELVAHDFVHDTMVKGIVEFGFGLVMGIVVGLIIAKTMGLY